jgi:hypothetical protein
LHVLPIVAGHVCVSVFIVFGGKPRLTRSAQCTLREGVAGNCSFSWFLATTENRIAKWDRKETLERTGRLNDKTELEKSSLFVFLFRCV